MKLFCVSRPNRIFFFDLDGPILDVSHKYYRVYADIVNEMDLDPVSKEAYWNYKRNRVSESKFTQFKNEQEFNYFRSKRADLIETEHYLNFDTLQPKLMGVLDKLRPSFSICLVTLRHSGVGVRYQLHRLGIADYFDFILNAGHRKDMPGWQVKKRMIESKFEKRAFKSAFFIGDTETDINCAQSLGITSIAVSNGIRSERLLKEINPDYLLSSSSQLLNISL